MKTLIAVLFASLVVQAQVETAAPIQLNCVVPVENAAPVITVAIEAIEESQGDFLTVTIQEPGKELVYFNQLDKGSVRAGLAEGQLVSLVVAEGVTVENGAVRGAGFVVLSKIPAGISGFLSLNNSFYPVQCK